MYKYDKTIGYSFLKYYICTFLQTSRLKFIEKMQNKGLIRLFAILFGLVSLYQLSFTYFAGNVEDDAKAYAKAKVTNDDGKALADFEKKYIDSILKNISTNEHIQYLNFSNDSLCYDRKFFYNSSHMNKRGSTIFSEKIGNLINEKK